MLFINDTSANFEQASKLKFSSRRMTYTENGTKYHAYKDRKGGEVSYSITAGYSGRFKRYLEFRAFLVENNPSDELFPFIRHPRKYRSGNIQDRRLRTLMSLLGRPFVPASVLRTCALNKVLQEGGNIDDVLKLGQHSRRTFFRSYFLPNHQLASKEWSDFFKFVNDRRKAALVFGGCSGESGKKIPIVAGGSPEPDCINPAGCLFCVHYRGEESMDYIWALLSYKKLKCLEYACSKAAALSDSITPLEGLLARIADVESQFIVKAALQESHSEASERILEENYHPYWRGFIELLERQ